MIPIRHLKMTSRVVKHRFRNWPFEVQALLLSAFDFR